MPTDLDIEHQDSVSVVDATLTVENKDFRSPSPKYLPALSTIQVTEGEGIPLAVRRCEQVEIHICRPYTRGKNELKCDLKINKKYIIFFSFDIFILYFLLCIKKFYMLHKNNGYILFYLISYIMVMISYIYLNVIHTYTCT